MNTVGSQKSASGARTSSALKPRQAVRIHHRHSLASPITPSNPSHSILQAARGLCAQGFGAQFASNFLQQQLTAQTQAPLGH